MKKMFGLMAILILGMLALSGCGQQVQGPTGNAVKNAPVLSDENPATDVQEVSMGIVVGTFTPNQITVKKGVPVKLSVTTREIDPKFKEHGFAIKELGIDEKIAIGETKVIEFTPTKTGSFVFFCSVYCGQGHIGQTGILHVIE